MQGLSSLEPFHHTEISMPVDQKCWTYDYVHSLDGPEIGLMRVVALLPESCFHSFLKRRFASTQEVRPIESFALWSRLGPTSCVNMLCCVKLELNDISSWTIRGSISISRLWQWALLIGLYQSEKNDFLRTNWAHFGLTGESSVQKAPEAFQRRAQSVFSKTNDRSLSHSLLVRLKRRQNANITFSQQALARRATPIAARSIEDLSTCNHDTKNNQFTATPPWHSLAHHCDSNGSRTLGGTMEYTRLAGQHDVWARRYPAIGGKCCWQW